MGLSPLGISPQVNLEKEISIYYFTFKKIARGIFPYCIPECSLFLTTSFSVACVLLCKKQTEIKFNLVEFLILSTYTEQNILSYLHNFALSSQVKTF